MLSTQHVLVILENSCGKLHCQKGFNSIIFLCKNGRLDPHVVLDVPRGVQG